MSQGSSLGDKYTRGCFQTAGNMTVYGGKHLTCFFFQGRQKNYYDGIAKMISPLTAPAHVDRLSESIYHPLFCSLLPVHIFSVSASFGLFLLDCVRYVCMCACIPNLLQLSNPLWLHPRGPIYTLVTVRAEIGCNQVCLVDGQSPTVFDEKKDPDINEIGSPLVDYYCVPHIQRTTGPVYRR